MLNELERFPVSWTAVSSLNWTLEVSSGESVEKLNPEREQQWIMRDVLLQCWRDFLNFYKLRWACLDCGRGPVSTARGLCPINTRAAWTRLHGNIPVDLRHRTEGPEVTEWIRPIYMTHTICFKRLFAFLAWAVQKQKKVHAHTQQKRKEK